MGSPDRRATPSLPSDRWQYPLLARDGGFAAPQDKLLYLARRRLWQVVDEAHPLRSLEVGQAVTHVKLELIFGRFGAISQDDKGMGCFAPFLVPHADDGDLLHRRVTQQTAFDLYRGDVFAAADDDVFV